MIKTRSFFVTSTGTGIGKTFISVKIIEYFLKNQITIEPFKPVLSGYDKKNIKESDSGKLLTAINTELSFSNIESISPWLFSRPVAPTLAAKYENKKITFQSLKKWCIDKKRYSNSNYQLFEGAGGLMVPIQKRKTFINLFKELRMPVILIVGSYLGTISHTLSAYENLKTNKIDIINIIINEGNKKAVSYQENLSLLKESLPNKILIRGFSNNFNFQNKQIQLIASDILEYFSKMA